METGALGKVYGDGDVIVQQGDVGDQMFVIQDGQVEVIVVQDDQEKRLNVLGPGDFFGEMAILERKARSATVRALGQARVLTVDSENLMRRFHKDPSLVYRMLETMSHRIRSLTVELAR